MRRLFLSFIVSFVLLNASAQTQVTGWLASFNTFKIGKKTSIHFDGQFRSSDQLEHVQTLLLRTGLNFHVTKQLTITGGYAFIDNRRVIGNVSGTATEHRAWEQLLFTHKIKFVGVAHRLRLEQRFLPLVSVQNNELQTDDHTMAMRLRYFFRNVIPFKKTADFQKGMFGAIQNEVFVNVTDLEKVNGKFFDQNRFYLAIGYRVSKHFDLEAGYLNQYVLGRTGRTNNHVAQLATYLKL